MTQINSLQNMGLNEHSGNQDNMHFNSPEKPRIYDSNDNSLFVYFQYYFYRFISFYLENSAKRCFIIVLHFTTETE